MRGATINQSEIHNSRSNRSYAFHKIWKKYVHSIINNRKSRLLIDQEHLGYAKLMFNTLTNKNANGIVAQSYKTFLSTSIDYVYS
jgi:hypothetical protein